VTVHLVGAGPGDPGLLTRRGAQLLADADVVLFDRLVDEGVLELANERALLIDVGKRARDRASPSQAEINGLLVSCARTFDVVVRLKGGDPFVFGRGAEEVEALHRAGIATEVVPGVSSAFGVPASVGISVTTRGVASAVAVLTGHDVTGGAVKWARLAGPSTTLVVLMATAQLAAIRSALLAAGLPSSTPCAVIERGTTGAETTREAVLETLHTIGASPPAVLVVGDVVAGRAVGTKRGVWKPAPEPARGRGGEQAAQGDLHRGRLAAPG